MVCNDELVIKHVLCDDEGRAVAIDINVHSENFHLVNFYAPLGGVNSVYADQEFFFGWIHQLVLSKYPTLIGGDFNCVDNPALIAQILIQNYLIRTNRKI